MKYIDADRLRAEIEKLDIQNTSDLWDGEDDDQCYGYDLALDHIKRLIDSLQQEQPEVDLEKESLKYFSEIRVKDDETPILCDFKFKVNFATIARHFFELGLKARKEEQL